jgi:murein L,D-transpeptidase YafK
LNDWRTRLFAVGLAMAAGALAAGCEDALEADSGRSLRPIPDQTLALMDKIGTTPSAPVLIRTYKQEAEFEIWKMKSDGQYALLKTYPMCRWSGQLGPKLREGDHQVPEGFYTIAPGQMNPNSHYYLSFNVGYPNAYDRALGRTGGDIMVHGVCSSAGCFSMTDAQIGEIYAVAREAFNGGERAIQMQAFPFRMTAENLAKHRLDPNIAFWKEIKNGADHFEVTKTEPEVLVCGKHYVFGAHTDQDVDASAPCPANLQRDDQVEAAVAERESGDDAAVAALVAQGVKPVKIVYQDGGQNAAFAGREDLDPSAPEALAAGPTVITLDNSGKPLPPVVKVAAAAETPASTVAPAAANAPQTASPAPQPAANGAAPSSPFGFLGGGQTAVKSFFGLGGSDAPQVKVFEPAQPIPTDAPLPPKRDAALDARGPQAMADSPALAQ